MFLWHRWNIYIFGELIRFKAYLSFVQMILTLILRINRVLICRLLLYVDSLFLVNVVPVYHVHSSIKKLATKTSAFWPISHCCLQCTLSKYVLSLSLIWNIWNFSAFLCQYVFHELFMRILSQFFHENKILADNVPLITCRNQKARNSQIVQLRIKTRGSVVVSSADYVSMYCKLSEMYVDRHSYFVSLFTWC